MYLLQSILVPFYFAVCSPFFPDFPGGGHYYYPDNNCDQLNTTCDVTTTKCQCGANVCKARTSSICGLSKECRCGSKHESSCDKMDANKPVCNTKGDADNDNDVCEGMK